MEENLSPELIELIHSLESRDQRDAITGEELQDEMLADGFYPIFDSEELEIDTGKNGGVEETVDLIVQKLSTIKDYKMITIEGLSGTGKSTASKVLAERIGACVISSGEIFRYLAYEMLAFPGKKAESILRGIEVKPIKGKAQLWKKGVNISEKYQAELRRPDVEKLASINGATCQLQVYNLLRREVKKLRETSDLPLVMEGRSYNLIYFPADLRVKLKADMLVRAQKRLNQWN